MEPEDLCNLVHVWCMELFKLSKKKNISVKSKVNDLNVEPVVPCTLENFSKNVILTLKPWNIECIALN